MPDGIWGKLYIIFFEFHEDRVASYVMTLISLLVLIVGTAHAIGYLAPIHWVGAYSWAVTWFWLRSEEHTSELQSLMRISYAVFCLKKKKQINAQLISDIKD